KDPRSSLSDTVHIGNPAQIRAFHPTD
ncbi:hypothetical protein J2X81_003943, partial [Sinomonas atrocyanea]|nr:hypothetical protein [Sinomonas atrocyanea]